MTVNIFRWTSREYKEMGCYNFWFYKIQEFSGLEKGAIDDVWSMTLVIPKYEDDSASYESVRVRFFPLNSNNF